MAVSVNLMTSPARNAAAADRVLRGWLWAAGVTISVFTLAAAWTWCERRELALEHEALEAAYEPIRELASANRGLRVQASELLSRDAVALTLSRERPIVTLLAKVNKAVAAAGGSAYIESINLGPSPVAASEAQRGEMLTLNIFTLLDYDVSRAVKDLAGEPFTSVKVASTETLVDGSVPRKKYVIHCEF